uniref:Ycf20-like protein n=1 Tax=Anthurium amnicola TaxID=1678845 RepID=A0A1D1YWC0_9ARAE
MAATGCALTSRVPHAHVLAPSNGTKASLGILDTSTPKSRRAPRPGHLRLLRVVRAVQDNGNEGPPRRLVDIVRLVPEISRNYFRSPSRRALFGGISLLGGFYVAQTISLSFGALGVNDVIAAVVCVLVTEYVTRFYYSRPKVTFPLALLNNFKMGFTYGLFIDAFKLAS